MLIQRLGLPFSCENPDIDELPVQGETPEQLVCRLAYLKATKIAGNHTGTMVIGSDQVAVLDNEILSKPDSHDQAIIQLGKLSGKSVWFHTGLCLINNISNTVQSDCINYKVNFRTLSQDEIESYLKSEQPYDCAGSFKSEGLGITLLKSMTGDDPTALIGLPLIRLSEMFRQEGLALP